MLSRTEAKYSTQNGAVFKKMWSYISTHAYAFMVFTGKTFFFNGSTAPWGPRPPNFSRLRDHTLRHTTLGRTPRDEGPARGINLYMTTNNTHKRQISMAPVGFEPTIPTSERPQTHALDCAAIGIGFSAL
jgi:hypothetical protein